MNDTLIITIGVVVPILVWMGMKFFDGNKEKLITTKEHPIDKRNKQKEIEVLDRLLQDIRDNTYAWTYTNYNISSMASASIINDDKGIAIVLSETSLLRTTGTLAVNFGLKDISKYKHTNNANVSLHMQGKHVTKFCISVEDALDSRGHELDFFKEQIKNKL